MFSDQPSTRELFMHKASQTFPCAATGTLYGVGIGPGDPEQITLRAAAILRSVDIVFTVDSPNAEYSISRSVVETLAPLKGHIEPLLYTMAKDPAVRAAQERDNAAQITRALASGQNCAFATLGDPMTYSTFSSVLRLVRENLPNVEVEVAPGITSFAMLAAKSCESLTEKTGRLCLAPAFRPEMADSLEFAPGTSTVLLKTYRRREALFERLKKEKDATVIYGERLCLKGEYMTRDLAAMAERPETYLSLMLVKKP